MFVKKFSIAKFYAKEGGAGGREYHDFPSKICSLTVPKNFVEDPLCFRKKLVSQIFMKSGGRGREGVSRFSVETLLSHITENIRRGSLQCFTNLGYRKSLCKLLRSFSVL